MEKTYHTTFEKKNIDLKFKIKKVKNLITYLDKYYKNKFIHTSDKVLSLNYFRNSNKINGSLYTYSTVYYNPYGLWFGVGSSWINYVKSWNNSYTTSWINPKYVYEIKINKENVLHIKSYKSLIKFHKKYAVYIEKNGYNINWNNVKKDYDGLIISPYLGDKIWNKLEGFNKVTNYIINSSSYEYIKNTLGKNIMKYPEFYLEWYRHWEATSGVIRKSGINEINLIKKNI